MLVCFAGKEGNEDKFYSVSKGPVKSKVTFLSKEIGTTPNAS